MTAAERVVIDLSESDSGVANEDEETTQSKTIKSTAQKNGQKEDHSSKSRHEKPEIVR